jgi:hypothetical protein
MPPEQILDANDSIYETYGIDFSGIFGYVYEEILGFDPDAFAEAVKSWWDVYSIIAILLSLFFFTMFIYSKIRDAQLSDIEQEELRRQEARWAAKYEDQGAKNLRWDTIQRRISDSTPEAWRLAIIEADILLDETLSNAGYVGQSVGEKLKTANPQSFTTIQDAWEAHKVRNEIAHVGSDFVLTKKTAQDTILRFERVFREFGII